MQTAGISHTARNSCATIDNHPEKVPSRSDRRSFIGAAMGGALMIAASPAIAGGRVEGSARWRSALLAYRQAEAAMDHAAGFCIQAENRFHQISTPAPRDGITLFSDGKTFSIEEAIRNQAAAVEAHTLEIESCRERSGLNAARAAEEKAASNRDAAWQALLATDAPDIGAIASKIEIAIHRDAEIADLASVIDDLHRLGGI